MHLLSWGTEIQILILQYCTHPDISWVWIRLLSTLCYIFPHGINLRNIILKGGNLTVSIQKRKENQTKAFFRNSLSINQDLVKSKQGISCQSVLSNCSEYSSSLPCSPNSFFLKTQRCDGEW